VLIYRAQPIDAVQLCRVPAAARRACQEAGVPYEEGVHAAHHCLVNVLPLIVACNVEDIQAECAPPPYAPYNPQRLLLYDPQPGGLGISRQVCFLSLLILEAADDWLPLN
jgi:DEAD/DEAH box helicase domain-containing protein